MSGTLSPWPVVQNGSQGHPIRALQFLLRAHGHNLTVDGMFGPATEAAVKAFQTSKGMTADGIMSAQTWSTLIIQVKKGSSGDAVRGVQEEFQFRAGEPGKGLKVGHNRTVRSEASKTLCRSTFHLSSWMGLSVRSLGRHWSAACCRDR
jgi:peptidoglycan hydrolase-like protein with peptidoglycan-binding domain